MRSLKKSTWATTFCAANLNLRKPAVLPTTPALFSRTRVSCCFQKHDQTPCNWQNVSTIDCRPSATVAAITTTSSLTAKLLPGQTENVKPGIPQYPTGYTCHNLPRSRISPP